MAANFVIVPQWQGSGSARAMRLIDGAEAIRGDLPSASTVTVEVPLGAGTDEGTSVQRISAVHAVRDAQAAVLATQLGSRSSGVTITIGGDCGVELASIAAVAASHERLAVLWLDAHPDLHTPESSPSGAFTGMVLRTLLGDGHESLVPLHPLAKSRVIVGGARSVDDAEDAFLDSSEVQCFGPTELDAPAVRTAIEAMDADALYVHIDLDVLDPADLAGLNDPVPFGVSLTTLLEVIVAAKALLPLVGGGISGFAPTSPTAADDDLGTILRLVGALTAGS